MWAALHARAGPRPFALVGVWSFVLGLVSAAPYWLAAIPLDVRVPASAALLLQGLVAFGVAIPSSPGFFGPFEAVTRATLALYGVAPTQAVTYAVAYHLAVFVPISLLGLWSLSRAHVHLADLGAKVRAADEAGAAEEAGERR